MSPELGAAIAVLGAGWPLALAAAAANARSRLQERARVRRLNEALHELRRPMQALVLGHRARTSPDPLEMALAALRDLDAEINGGARENRRRPVDLRDLAAAAVTRWRSRARAAGRAIRIQWEGGEARADVDPVRISQALDNLIANALEHGRGEIVLRGVRRGPRIAIEVRDGGPRRPVRLRTGNPRHGHGLRVAHDVARRHRGSLRLRPGRRGTVAAILVPAADPG
jgi:signal transduction histidine kinase